MNLLFRRGIALIVDIVICFVIEFFIIYTMKLDILRSIGLANLINLIVIIVYFTIQESAFSYTIGKKILKLKVISSVGNKISFRTALIRNLLRVIDHLLVGYILVFIDNENKRLGDMLAKTRVVLN